MDQHFIETSIRKLKEASVNNQLVVFVGSGVSVNSGVPTWKEIITSMAKDLGIPREEIGESLETYLRIPQYYYNERGEKEYFDKIQSIFQDKEYSPNPLHKEIFKLNPTHIITTNYDDLLEKEVKNHDHYYHIVKNDQDMPYNTLDKMIIKMHGDFAKKNIVLKEEDYLTYSNNFLLIENYLKSLFATKTVLFVGYSASDPNFMLILQWVKDILKNHFQPAYLVEVDKQFSNMQYNYYKNRGINNLFIKKRKIEYEELEKDNVLGNRLFSFLKSINNFDEDYEENEIYYVYNKLKNFKHLNFIMPKEIARMFSNQEVFYDVYRDNHLTLLKENHILKRIFTKHQTNCDQDSQERKNEEIILKEIIEILKKANIDGVSEPEKIIKEWKKEKTFTKKITEDLINFDSKKKTVLNFSSSLMPANGTYGPILKEAYYYYQMNDYKKAYDLYKQISRESFQKKEYLSHFISEFNRKQVGRLYDLNEVVVNGEATNEEIKQEIDEINLDNIYTKIPYKDKKGLEFLKNLSNLNMYYSERHLLDNKVEKIKETKGIIERGGTASNSTINQVINIVENVWAFTNLNYLCVDHYSEIKAFYKKYIEGILVNYSIESKQTHTFFFKSSFAQIDSFNEFDLYLMITAFKQKELNELFINQSVYKIKVDEKGKKYLLECLESLIDSMERKNPFLNNNSLIENIMILLKRIYFTEDENQKIIKIFLKLFDNTQTDHNKLKYMNQYIVEKINQNEIKQTALEDLLESYLNFYLKDSMAVEIFRGNRLLTNIVNTLANMNVFEIKFLIITKFISEAEFLLFKEEKDGLYSLMNNIILLVYPVVHHEEKEKIEFISKKMIMYIEKKNFLNDQELEFYFEALRKNVIKVNKKINQTFLQTIENEKQMQKIEEWPDPVERKLNFLTELYRKGYFKRNELKDYIDKFKGRSEYFDLFFDEFVQVKNINLLIALTEEEITKIMNNKAISEQIYDLIEKELPLLTSEERINLLLNKYYKKK